MQRVQRGDTTIAVTDRGGTGSPVLLLHGLAGSSREMLPTADALTDSFRVLLMDQRGHGDSTRRPADLSRKAFVDDVITVIEELAPNERVSLVGQSMGAHTAFLTAARRPDLVERLVMLEGHVAGETADGTAQEIGEFFAAWPTPFSSVESAKSFLGDGPLAKAWIADLEATPEGMRPRFDPDMLALIVAAVHEPRWTEWDELTTPTLAVFADAGMFTPAAKDELIRRRPCTMRADIPGASHDAHLDAFDSWIDLLRNYLRNERRSSSPSTSQEREFQQPTAGGKPCAEPS